jgi:UPF0755 protein
MNSKDTAGTFIDVVVKIIVAVLVIIFIYKGALLAYGYGYRVFTEEPVTKGDGKIISVEIKKGESASSIGKMLESKGLIRDHKLFVIQERLSGYHKKEAAGIYDLNTSMTTDQMLAIMAGEDISSTDAATATETYYVDNGSNASETGTAEAGTAAE